MCHYFENTLLNTLPRELRDQIYEHLLQDEAGVMFTKLLKNQVKAAEIPGSVNLCNSNFPLPLYTDAELVGHTMAIEVLETVYYHVFRKCNIHPQNIKSFLKPNLPGLDVSSARFVRKVQIEWENRNAGSGLLFSRDIPEDQLQALDLLPHNRGVVVENIIRCAMIEDVNHVGAFMEKFRPIYERLTSYGIDMRFVGEERLESFKYFTSPTEWASHFEAIKQKVSWSLLRMLIAWLVMNLD